MKLRVHEKSLFAILWRSPWWISAVIAAALFVAAKVLLPERYADYGFFVALPFALIALATAWKQLRKPSAGRVAETVDALRAMSWDDFSTAVEEAYRRDGYAVTRLAGAGADFELAKAGRITLLGAKRWKAARTGVEPLRALHAAARSRGAGESIYFAAGELSDTARAFAAEKGIRLVQDAELERLLPGTRRAAKKAA
jgi:restriction system protein